MRETVGLVFAHYYMLGHDTGRQRAQLFFFQARAPAPASLPQSQPVASSHPARREDMSERARV